MNDFVVAQEDLYYLADLIRFALKHRRAVPHWVKERLLILCTQIDKRIEELKKDESWQKK